MGKRQHFNSVAGGKRARRILVGLGTLLALGCGQANEYQPPPPPSITVALPVQKSVIRYLEETGTTEAVEKVEIRARVEGFLERVNFEPGADVQEDDVLYVIEPRLFKAEVDAADAELASAKVELNRAEIEFDRQTKLYEENATAERNVVLAEAELNAAKASVQAAAAKLDQAELDLEYTQVKSPISGRVGKTLVKLGNLVGNGEATHLTTVIRYDPIYANFNISERTLLELRRHRGDAPRSEDVEREQIKLFLQRANDEGFPFEGHFDYADLAVDQSTGTFMIRGIFENPNLEIFPGLFVRVRIAVGVLNDALLVPEQAIGGDQAGRYLLVVDDENKVERRNVTVGPKYEEMVVIEKGLNSDERVVIEGVQRARPGAEVSPKENTLAFATEAIEAIEQGTAPPPEDVLEDEPAVNLTDESTEGADETNVTSAEDRPSS